MLILKRIEYPPKINIEKKATIFVEKEIHFLSCQFLMIGPNVLFDNNHWCHLLDDLAKHPADNKRKGVVGNNGKNTPMPAIPRNIKPNNLYKNMMIHNCGRLKSVNT